MSANNLNRKPDSALLTLSENVYSVIFNSGGGGLPNTYDIPDALLASLNTNNGTFGTKIDGAFAARQSAIAATDEKAASRESVLADLRQIAGLIYSNPDITPAMINDTGLAVHDSDPSSVPAIQPMGFQAVPKWDGSVELSWNRENNAYGNVFVIEQSTDGANWTQVTNTKKSGLTLQGYSPGVETFFRVFAKSATVQSNPSPVAVIYPSAETQIALEEAA